jgi:hypothetical protein
VAGNYVGGGGKGAGAVGYNSNTLNYTPCNVATTQAQLVGGGGVNGDNSVVTAGALSNAYINGQYGGGGASQIVYCKSTTTIGAGFGGAGVVWVRYTRASVGGTF